MRYVIIRDDDTNATTPVDCLERLYRPFLERNLPVNLATIPEVNTNARTPDGKLEGFLFSSVAADVSRRSVPQQLTSPPPYVGGYGEEGTAAISANSELVRYLIDNLGYHIVQHGCHHEPMEFDLPDRAEAARRIEKGTAVLVDAGFSRPQAFVAPHDKLSPASLQEVAARFRVISSGWYEWRRLPPSWWPRYGVKQLLAKSHWHKGKTVLLSHPGCLLSYHRAPDTILETIVNHVASHRVTVLVTHWWEYFYGGQPNERFISVLHELAAWLARHQGVKVISFDDLARGDISIN